jgi:hypothetical protein
MVHELVHKREEVLIRHTQDQQGSGQKQQGFGLLPLSCLKFLKIPNPNEFDNKQDKSFAFLLYLLVF